MTATVEQRMLSEEIDNAIADITNPTQSVTCEAHGGLARGVVTLLKIERFRLQAQPTRQPRISIGGITVSSASGVAIVLAVYVLLKLHGIDVP